ncbi:RcnB family protein [Stakelama sediminis]|uniref:Ni/Co efflux regulator RcnB n=1 Tax=Stakelama sediminis TaxID=463200 RepID=A0A840YY98_9SPHN|nr:RcnB family protein [Stakelama sediminis]MBB5718486.1 Ni/Co efflux regulator RcnB [Stakelama sediminis]
MKTFIAAAVATSMLATPAFAATRGHDNDRGRAQQTSQYHGKDQRNVTINRTVNRNTYRAPQKVTYRQPAYRSQTVRYQTRNWQRGERFDARYTSNYRVVNNPRAYRLYNAPYGYHWVRSGNDAVLVGVTSGIIAAVLANALN